MNNIRIKTQGQEAGHSGRMLEEDIKRQFEGRNVLVVNYSENKGNDDLFEDVRLVRRVPYRNLYNSKSYSEFVFYGIKPVSVRIECKWQEMAGSVDEKLPYLFFNAELMPESHVWLIIGGHGMRLKARQWLEHKIRNARKQIRVLSPDSARSAIKLLAERNDPGSWHSDIPYSPLHRPPQRRSLNGYSSGRARGELL